MVQAGNSKFFHFGTEQLDLARYSVARNRHFYSYLRSFFIPLQLVTIESVRKVPENTVVYRMTHNPVKQRLPTTLFFSRVLDSKKEVANQICFSRHHYRYCVMADVIVVENKVVGQ